MIRNIKMKVKEDKNRKERIKNGKWGGMRRLRDKMGGEEEDGRIGCVGKVKGRPNDDNPGLILWPK